MPDIDLMGATYPDVPAVDLPRSGGGTVRFYDPSEIAYAGSPTSGGNANMTNAILYGAVDGTSTATAFTATVAGLTELVDGTTVMLRNGVVTSASGFTINVNGLGALPVYSNMATGNAITPTNPTRETTIFNINYTMMLTYVESDVVAGGCWVCYRGYDANTNTIGYQLRTNSSSLVAVETGYKYRIWLTTADGSKMMPINTSTATNATTNRSLNQRKFDPFGRIVYRATNGTCSANAALGATGIWDQYTLTIGYSYMQTGFSLTSAAPVYIKATPQADGSAVMSSIVQALPSTNDGFIYVMLGFAYSATAMELYPWHPVYWHDGTAVRKWTGATPVTSVNGSTGAVTVQPTLVSGTNIKTVNNESLLGSGNITISGGGGGVAVRGARVTVPQRASTAQSSSVAVSGLGGIDAHDIVLFFGTSGYDVRPVGFEGGSYKVNVSGVSTNAFDAFAAIVSPNYEVGSQASIVGSNASLCNTTTPLVGDTVTITATSGATFKVYDAASGGEYASSGTVAAGGTYSFTVECATSYIAATASGGGND